MPDALNDIIHLIDQQDSLQNPSGKLEDIDLAELYSFAELMLPFMENGLAEIVLNQEETDFDDQDPQVVSAQQKQIEENEAIIKDLQNRLLKTFRDTDSYRTSVSSFLTSEV